jgi:glycosyltransferase involved in cell wall biosynthesis
MCDWCCSCLRGPQRAESQVTRRAGGLAQFASSSSTTDVSQIPDSAFITVGESLATMDAAQAGCAPKAEYFVLRRDHFSAVHSMVDTGMNPASMPHGARFALDAYRRTADMRHIYLGEEFPGIQYLAIHALRRSKKRIAMLIHNVASKRRSLPLKTLRLAGLVDHLLCLSEASRQELITYYGYPSSRITIAGSRVDTEFFRPDRTATVQAQVCSAGAVNRDYETLIAAVEPLSVPLKIAADTQWRFTAETKSVGELPAFVEMRSWGNYVNLRQLYAESAVVVVPLARSLMSGVTVALEAMAMGKPVIMTDIPYVADYMIDGEHGFLVPRGDADTLRARIRFLLDNPAEAERMGQRAREWVLSRFTVEHYVNRILSVWS